MSRRGLTALLMVMLMVLLAGCGGGGGGGQAVTLMHVHGLGYTPDGERLFVPAHDGFRVYQQGQWQNPDLPRHDYMGFAATRAGFYSSGHPAQGSGLPNPLGLLFSPDWGQSLTDLGFRGKVDFHLTGAGYENQVLYVFNPTPQPNLPRGINRTEDRGKSWIHTAANGVSGDLYNLAAHPTRAEVVALATSDGLFLSDDGGESFRQTGQQAIAVTFHPDGKRLLFGVTDLISLDLASGQVQPLASPRLNKEDMFVYLAVNPARPDEIAISTAQRDLFMLRGGKWQKIANDGKGR